MTDFMSLFFLFLISSQTVKAETVLTQTVGTAAFQVITSREVKANEMISRSLEKEMKDPSLEISQDIAGRALLEIAVFREAQSLSAVKLDSEDVSALVSTVKNRLQKNPDWKRLDVTDEELKTWVERKKVSSEYMKLKASSLTAIVTDQEIQDYYDKNRVKFGSTPLEDQRSNIRLFLQKDSQRQRVQEWMNALKTKYQIKNDLADLGTTMDSDTQATEPKKTKTPITPSSKFPQRDNTDSKIKQSHPETPVDPKNTLPN